jgi:hypothetical protein
VFWPSTCMWVVYASGDDRSSPGSIPNREGALRAEGNRMSRVNEWLSDF